MFQDKTDQVALWTLSHDSPFFFFLEIKLILIFSLPKMSLSLVPKAMWTTRASTEAWSRGQRIMQWCNLLEKHGEVRISSIKANTEIRN